MDTNDYHTRQDRKWERRAGIRTHDSLGEGRKGRENTRRGCFGYEQK